MDIVLKSREKGSFKLVPVKEEDTIIDKRDIIAELMTRDPRPELD